MRRACLALCLIALAPVLAGCARTADRDAVASCSSAAAGLALPVRIRVTAAAPLPRDAEGRPGVRLTLAPEAPGQETPTPAASDAALPWIVCRFDPAGPGADLVALATPAGPLDDTHLILLRRFWLGSLEADALARERLDGSAAVPSLPFAFAYALQQGLNALPDACVYGLIAAAYSLVYGLYGRINLAFGELAAVGGLGAVVAAGLARDAPAATILIVAGGLGAYAAALHGAAVDRLVLWPLRRAGGQHGLVATIGTALALREYLRLATNSQPVWVAPVLADPLRLARAGDFVVTVTPMALVLAGATALASAGLLALFRWSGFGRDWRASADDPLAAALMGVDPRRLSLRTAALASALVGLAGAGVTLNFGGIGFDYTTGLGLKALIAAVLGGIGSIPGAFLGGIGIALVETAWSAYLPAENRDLAIDVLLVAALVVRPGGLFGAREPVARRRP